jgi:BioD-like phosphotransacetylase family protein
VAQWLNASVVLVAEAGLGSTIDEMELNLVLCERYNVPVAGIIVNHARPEDSDSCALHIERALHQRLGPDIPLLGCIPHVPFLDSLNLSDIQQSLPGSYFLAPVTEDHKIEWHYPSHRIELVETALEEFLLDLHAADHKETLHVCHASREDIILGYIADYQHQRRRGELPFNSCMIVCGTDETPLSTFVTDILELQSQHNDDADWFPPILVTPHDTWETMERIRNFTPKHCAQDTRRVESAVEHYEPHIDFDLLLNRVGYFSSSSLRDNNRQAMAAYPGL